MSDPKIIVWDIETNFNLLLSYNLFTDYIPHDHILQERYLLSVAWKELGSKKVQAVSLLDDPERFAQDPHDDYHIVKTIHEVLSDADAIVHHFGDKFDIRMFNARLIYHGFPPLPDIIQIDTYKIAQSKFRFNSNKLDYLGEYLGLGRKIQTDRQLWIDCWNGDKKAIREMVRYNKQDVELLEQVYLKLAPYAPAKLNLNHFYGDDEFEPVCPRCGGSHLQQRGKRYTRTNEWVRMQCQECGGWSSAPMKQDGSIGKLR